MSILSNPRQSATSLQPPLLLPAFTVCITPAAALRADSGTRAAISTLVPAQSKSEIALLRVKPDKNRCAQSNFRRQSFAQSKIRFTEPSPWGEGEPKAG